MAWGCIFIFSTLTEPDYCKVKPGSFNKRENQIQKRGGKVRIHGDERTYISLIYECS